LFGEKYDSSQSDEEDDVAISAKEKHNRNEENTNKGKRKNIPSSLVSVASSKKTKQILLCLTMQQLTALQN
jgi:hypothetical protein